MLFTSVRGVKYLNDQSHCVAWCNACLNLYVRKQQDIDRLRAVEDPSFAERSANEIREQGEH